MVGSAGEGGIHLLGVDAGCRTVLAPLLDAGDLPAVERLLADGTWGSLESQIPPWTASAWPSLYAGKNPGTHGVYGFLSFNGTGEASYPSYESDRIELTRGASVKDRLSELGYVP